LLVIDVRTNGVLDTVDDLGIGIADAGTEQEKDGKHNDCDQN
jgi:hypothetical protein